MPIWKYKKEKQEKIKKEKEKREKKKKQKDKKKKEVVKQTQKQSQNVIVNVVKEVKRRRPVAKPVAPVRPTFIQSFTTPQPQQQPVMYTQGQEQGIRLGGREKAEFYEPVKEAIALPFVEADSNIGRHRQDPLKPTPPSKERGSVGRPKIYNTDEERRLAKLENSRRFREREKRRKEEERARNAPNMLERRNIINDEAITELQDFFRRDDRFTKDSD